MTVLREDGLICHPTCPPPEPTSNDMLVPVVVVLSVVCVVVVLGAVAAGIYWQVHCAFVCYSTALDFSCKPFVAGF